MYAETQTYNPIIKIDMCERSFWIIAEIAPFVSAKKMAVTITAFNKNHFVKVFMVSLCVSYKDYTFFEANRVYFISLALLTLVFHLGFLLSR